MGIYLCGPTVQGSPHIGHLRAAASFDILIRWLRRYELEVTYVRNVTDIDDKILTKAQEAGEQWWALAQRHEREFQAAYATLGLLPPTIEPRATGHIPDQIAMIERLIERGHAYTDGEGSVYFDVSSQPDYGSLTHQNPADMKIGEDDGDAKGKRAPHDFALWKAAKPGEPETAMWDSPWGEGRPGWHLECSAMSHRYLGEAFDIHGGGIDLRFPHHENEQAQSHAAGYDFANLWVHNAWVTIAGEKMAKSVGNTLDLASLLEVAPAPVIRFALSSVHYRSTIEWGPRTLELAAKAWEKLSSFVMEATMLVGEPDVAPDSLTPDQLPVKFTEAMNDDLNVAAALAVIYEHVKRGRKAMAQGELPESARLADKLRSVRDAVARGELPERDKLAEELLLVRSMLDVLGLDPLSGQWAGEADERAGSSGRNRAMEALGVLVEGLLDERQQARRERAWAKADELRDRLTALGIGIEDGPDGAKWFLTEQSES